MPSIGEYPIPTVADLANYSGRAANSYTAWANEALAQSTLLFVLTVEMAAPPDPVADPAKSQLALNAILQMADDVYLKQPYVPLLAKPIQSETIGSYCVDDRTTILTADGWKTCDQLRPGDLTLTLDADTWRTEWQPVQSVHIFPDEPREMLHVQGQRFSALTTMDHRWLAQHDGEPRWTTSRELSTTSKHLRIPFNAPHTAPTEAKYSDALVELVGWLWTDGGWSWKGRHRGVRIHQSHRVNSDKCARIRAALTEMFGPAGTSLRGEYQKASACRASDCTEPVSAMAMCNRHYMRYWKSDAYLPAHKAVTWTESKPAVRPGMTVFSLSAEASEVLTDHLTVEDKAVRTEFLRSLTHSQLLLFIEVSMLADNSGQKQLAQKNKQAAEQFMLACLLAGKRVSFRRQKSGMWQVTHTSAETGISLTAMRYATRSASKVEVVSHAGRVWCPRTPNQTWLAQRDGTVYFTGNTYNKGLGAFRETPSFLKAQIGHYTGLLWWDLAVREFGETLYVLSGAISVFDRSADVELDDTGRMVFLGPADKDAMPYPFDINAPEWPGPSVTG